MVLICVWIRIDSSSMEYQDMEDQDTSEEGLRRDLGTLESYAVLVGILVGAGIFRVTSDATAATGPSVILAHLVLAPIVLATSVAYLVFLSSPLGRQSGGEILHISRVLGAGRLTFLAAWLKLISYLGASAYLVDALALNLLELCFPGAKHGTAATTVLSLLMLVLFLGIHIRGVRWFGKFQVFMCAILAGSLVVLIVPGLFFVERAHYRPFFTGGLAGFGAALPALFFAYAGFEALSQASGEVRDSQRRLPRVFVTGIAGTSLIFVAMSVVAFGVLPASDLGATGVPMSKAAATYLPFGAELIVTLGAVMAVGTSLNASLLVPGRLAWFLAREGYIPEVFGELHATQRTPVVGLLASGVLVALLLLSRQMGLALGIAVVALMILYCLHSFALVLFQSRCGDLAEQALTPIPRWLQLLCAWLSIGSLCTLIGLQFKQDLGVMASSNFLERMRRLDLTSLEYLFAWIVIGLVLFRWRGNRIGRAAS